MVLVEFNMTRSFPKRFKYKISVSGRISEMFVESLGIADSLYCLPSIKDPSHSGGPRGMSRTFPMIGYPFGPGGSGRERLLLRR